MYIHTYLHTNILYMHTYMESKTRAKFDKNECKLGY